MISFERMGELLDEIAEGFPAEFYRDLNGGILLLPEVKENPEGEDLYTLGEYCRDQLGRYIRFYYGSFAIVMAGAGEGAWRRQLHATLAHEFTHHLEGLAGERGLEIKDAEFIERHKRARER